MNVSTKNQKHLRSNIDEVSKTKILVTAANGHTGFPAAKELLNLGFDVRAMVRNHKSKTAIELKRLGAEIFIGDMITRLAKDDKRINMTTKESIFRIYRDVRFAKDKTPYKISASALKKLTTYAFQVHAN